VVDSLKLPGGVNKEVQLKGVEREQEGRGKVSTLLIDQSNCQTNIEEVHFRDTPAVQQFSIYNFDFWQPPITYYRFHT